MGETTAVAHGGDHGSRSWFEVTVRQGSRQAINNTMYTLYARGYAQIYEWSPLQATDIPGEFMTVMTKYLMLG
ncbi:hypothetical protein BJP34_17875 [Moorena producens PAL-8-15-08-1]|uniref:Uncharacterized protein n=1 Tax=Moorena producens PAL-8-15-08-1 TaxID=1458985 RepID=A0A1D8TTT3_9CYAN|nr:hypothetical protein [Moorena producens]AOX01059.1 hypothetical protein BJP34_17875 [Moorena producens PAL-8-15-08-1]